MNGQTRSPQGEPRWPVVLAILAVLFLLSALSDRIRLFPMWVTYLAGLGVLTPIGLVGLTAGKTPWLRVERAATRFFAVVGGIFTLGNLANLVNAMLNHSAVTSGLQLFTSSIAIWTTNVILFSLFYWEIDRGGPEARGRGDVSTRPDWLFPQEAAPAGTVPQGWEPTFIDYLYLAFSTATAFSTTDAMPLTSRAKLLMMLEGTIALVTIVVVASRAMNILGGN